MTENRWIIPISETYDTYLRDESGLQGFAESISFPSDADEVSVIVRAMAGKNVPITIQGGKTGLCGGAVPFGGHLMIMSRMDRMKAYRRENEQYLITVEAGMTLEQLENYALTAEKGRPLFWPCAPSELTATVGGAAATGAGGIFSAAYGSCYEYIEAAELVTADGQLHRLTRGDKPDELRALIGGEGIPGVFTALTLRLVPKPAALWGICFFFTDDAPLCDFLDALRIISSNPAAGSVLAAAEYLDGGCLALIKERKASSSLLRGLPNSDEKYGAMLYVELHASENAVCEMASRLMEAAEILGSDQEATWAACGETETAKLRLMFHAAVEAVNNLTEKARISCSRITRLGADMCPGAMTLRETLAMYKEGACRENIKLYVFGNALEGKLHANLAPETREQYDAGIGLLREWARQVIAAEGDCVCDYGIGKLKQRIYDGLLFGKKPERLKALRETYDRRGIFSSQRR